MSQTPAFQNRVEAKSTLCDPPIQKDVINVYGEAGIGKSRLLSEAEQELRIRSLTSLVIRVDLAPVKAVTPAGRAEAALRAIIQQADGLLSGVWHDVDQAAGEVVAQLDGIAKTGPVVLMFDNTEAVQEDTSFWRWVEGKLVKPLLMGEGVVRQVFAGRIPVPWRDFDLRMLVKHLPLDPLSPHGEARDLVAEVLAQSNPERGTQEWQSAIDLVLELSHGHPRLSVELAAYLSPRWPVACEDGTRRELCDKVVKPFIEKFLFEGIEAEWRSILWWVSALDWFDTTVLSRFLNRVDSKLVEEKSQYFFMQGITRLRLHNTVIWRAEEGDRLYGLVADIVQQCLRVLEPQRYIRALQAAVDTFDGLAQELSDEAPDESSRYSREAAAYHQRAELMVALEANNGQSHD